MKKIIFIVLFCMAVLVAQAGHPQNAFKPDQIKWGPPPPFVNAGAQFAVLEGDPTASSGDFTIRIKMPDGYKIAPHWHPKRENVTVLRGDLKVGMGIHLIPTRWRIFRREALLTWSLTCTIM